MATSAPPGRGEKSTCVLAQKIDDRAGRLLQGKADIIDFDSEPVGDDRRRIVLFRQSPLNQEAPRLRERQHFMRVIL